MTLEETHQHVQNIIDDSEHSYKAARKPANKRHYKRVLELFQAIKKHLQPLEE